jgi:hypothetical protein
MKNSVSQRGDILPAGGWQFAATISSSFSWRPFSIFDAGED